MTTRFPAPLRPGALLAVTAPSSGVGSGAHPRLDLVLGHLRAQGFRVVEGECLRHDHHHASAPAEARAAELQRFLLDADVRAVLPPWGGELATELLERIDFDALRAARPTWLLGYSDISTLLMPLTLLAGWATAHGPTLMELVPAQSDPLTTGTLSVLGADLRQPVRQASSTRHQVQGARYEDEPDAPLNLTEPTRWRRLDGREEPLTLRGRLIGGCIDTCAGLAGTRFGDVPSFVRRAGADGAILYLENCETTPSGMVRTLVALRRHGWFDGLAGLLFGRNAGPDASGPQALSHAQAVRSVIEPLGIPALCDVDIGHRPPQFTLINGAFAEVSFAAGAGSIRQAAAFA